MPNIIIPDTMLAAMLAQAHTVYEVLLMSVLDVLPIILIFIFFQGLIIRRIPPHPKTIIIGFIYVLVGLSLFLVGLEQALFPIGRTMVVQLTDPAFLKDALHADGTVNWQAYGWVYVFACVIGFSTTIAEPALIAVALKAQQISGGTLNAFMLRIAVALGVAVGVGVGSFRIITGTPLPYYIIAGYMVVIIQTFYASKTIIPLAYDTGGVTTSTVTVPVLTALGIGLASTIPGRSPLLDGFGLIAFASIFPIMSVLGYAALGEWLAKRRGETPSSHQQSQQEHKP